MYSYLSRHLAALTLSSVALLTGCMHMSAPSNLDYSRTRSSEHGIYRAAIKPDGMIWVSWPKKSSGLQTDLTENLLRDTALPLGLVDIKVCAVDEIWSGLKFVIPVKDRGKAK